MEAYTYAPQSSGKDSRTRGFVLGFRNGGKRFVEAARNKRTLVLGVGNLDISKSDNGDSSVEASGLNDDP